MPDSLDNAIERLSAEFCPLVDPDDVTDVITQCSHELNTATKRARPELVEAVARKRLLDLAADTYTGVVDHCGWLRLTVCPTGRLLRPASNLPHSPLTTPRRQAHDAMISAGDHFQTSHVVRFGLGEANTVSMVDTKMIKSAGEHWVASMLARHSWAPALTRDGLERTDILAVKVVGEARQMIEIQVKASTAKSWPLGDLSTKLAKSPREWYALVHLPDDPRRPPRTFIIPRNHVAASQWIEHQAWLSEPGVAPGRRNAPHKSARSNLFTYLNYEDRWDLLGESAYDAPILLPQWLRRIAFDDRVGMPPWHPWAATPPDWPDQEWAHPDVVVPRHLLISEW